MAIKLDRDYDSKGVISAGAGIYVYDETISKYVLLVPTSDMPAGAGAPETIDNPILTTSYIGQVEGKQTLEQKEYTINWNRDNIRRLSKFAGKQCTFLERDGMEYTGNKFNGTLSFGIDAASDNAIRQGKVWITVTDDLGFVDDIRDLYALTATIVTPLPEVTLKGTEKVELSLSVTPGASVTAKSETETVATAAVAGNKLTITGVAEGYAIVCLTCSAEGEASSEKTLMVNVKKAD